MHENGNQNIKHTQSFRPGNAGRKEEMKTYYKNYGITACITDKSDGSAKLLGKDPFGKKLHDKIHKNRKAAFSAWKRLCD